MIFLFKIMLDLDSTRELKMITMKTFSLMRMEIRSDKEIDKSLIDLSMMVSMLLS
jgi:hypothetical protein